MSGLIQKLNNKLLKLSNNEEYDLDPIEKIFNSINKGNANWLSEFVNKCFAENNLAKNELELANKIIYQISFSSLEPTKENINILRELANKANKNFISVIEDIEFNSKDKNNIVSIFNEFSGFELEAILNKLKCNLLDFCLIYEQSGRSEKIKKFIFNKYNGFISNNVGIIGKTFQYSNIFAESLANVSYNKSIKNIFSNLNDIVMAENLFNKNELLEILFSSDNFPKYLADSKDISSYNSNFFELLVDEYNSGNKTPQNKYSYFLTKNILNGIIDNDPGNDFTYEGSIQALLENKNKINHSKYSHIMDSLLSSPDLDKNILNKLIFNINSKNLIDIDYSFIDSLGESESDVIKRLLELSSKNLFLKQEILRHSKDLARFVLSYMHLTLKPIDSVYHDALKNNTILPNKIIEIYYNSQNYEVQSLSSYTEILKIISKAQNFNQYCNFKKREISLGKIIHDNSSFFKENQNYAKLFFINSKLDLEEDYCSNFLECLKILNNYEESIKNIKLISEEFAKKNFKLDVNKFISNIESIKGYLVFFNEGKLAPVGDFVKVTKEVATDYSFIEMFDAVKEYINIAKPKNKKLFDLELSFNDFDFKVLKDGDPLHFRIGIDTDCCQRIGGAGEESAIDSFINQNAGVLILEKDNQLLSQSYFHYVPQDNGFILDNVEFNEENVKKYDKQIKDEQSNWLSNVYKEYGKEIKKKYPEINYILVGKSYSKINPSLFEKSSLEEDPRNFDVYYPYSDFDVEDHIKIV